VSFSDLSIDAAMSKASPKLMLAVATGEHIKQAVLTARDESGRMLMKVTFTDLLVTSYQTGGSHGAAPEDSFSLNYSKIEFEYFPEDRDGSSSAPVKAGYDLKLNKKV
jgi:type VI secretion system secreted protein Hcp